jgi:DNA-binding MarR family transcriptional regulator
MQPDLVTRRTSPTDRRRVTLALTAHGKAVLEAARQDTQARLAEILTALSSTERTAIVQAMQALRTVFVSPKRASPPGETKDCEN